MYPRTQTPGRSVRAAPELTVSKDSEPSRPSQGRSSNPTPVFLFCYFSVPFLLSFARFSLDVNNNNNHIIVGASDESPDWK